MPDTTSLQLTGQTALITGAAGGIGLAIARRLAGEGCRVLMTDIDADRLKAALGAIAGPGEAVVQAADLGSATERALLVPAVIARWGRLDILVNNAAYHGRRQPFLDGDDDELEQILAVNVVAAAALSRAAGRDMRQRQSGAIINIGSIQADLPVPSYAAYVASKGAVAALTRALAVELSPMAIEQFFAEAGIEPTATRSRYGTHHRAGAIELICGDVFDLDREALSGCTAFYDRAALIALPAPLRQRYADEVYAALPPRCRGLLVSLEYPPAELDGPPFAIDEAQVRALYQRDWSIEVLERQDILANQPAFQAQGLTSMNNIAYVLQRR